MILQELVDNGVVPWKWYSQDSEIYEADFTINNIDYRFTAELSEDERWNNWDLSFKSKFGYGLTGTGNSQKVMTTVVDIIREFIKIQDSKIEAITFIASEPSRQKLYLRMIKKLLPTWKLDTEREIDDYGDISYVLKTQTLSRKKYFENSCVFNTFLMNYYI